MSLCDLILLRTRMFWLQTVISPEVLLIIVGHEIIYQSSCQHTPSSVHPSLAWYTSICKAENYINKESAGVLVLVYW